MKLEEALAGLAAGGRLLVAAGEAFGADTIDVVSSADELLAVVRETIAARVATGYYEIRSPPDPPVFDLPAASALPAGRVRDAALEEIEQFARASAARQQDLLDARNALAALRDADLAAGYRLLLRRAHREAERFDVAPVRRLPPTDRVYVRAVDQLTKILAEAGNA